MSLPQDYAERVYAGVLGKIIGVYLGRPIECWPYERIMNELGEVDYYVNEFVPWKHPIVVSDDDITGTFTFLRAMSDYGNSIDLTPAQIGQTWLNYIIENKTILWWGGFGTATEHTAYLRLKKGVRAPGSGSIERNGRIIAQQIGAQIFVDGWAMVAPGDPELAADLAKRAASVSHDGEAILAAQVLAAMESQAFIDSDIDSLIDTATTFISKDSTIFRMITDLRNWHASEDDWHKCREKFAGIYNYENYDGSFPVVPNHGLIILGLLYGDGDFNKSMLVVNTAGWDTDCNSGNLGCLLGIRSGLKTFENGKDWRGPVADRIYLPTADGGRTITDAVIEANHIVCMGQTLAGERSSSPKDGARFNFEFGGSVQGFKAEHRTTSIENVEGHSRKGQRTLAIYFREVGSVSTATSILPDELDMKGYALISSPILYLGQIITLGLSADRSIDFQPFIRHFGRKVELETILGPLSTIDNGNYRELSWRVPDTGGQPIAQVGLEFVGENEVVYLDYLTWDGAPDIVLTRPSQVDHPWSSPQMWRRAWVNGVDLWEKMRDEPFHLAQNDGRGLLMQGTREWVDYIVEASIKPWLMDAGGIAARVQGLKRGYYFQLVEGGKARLLKTLDGDHILKMTPFEWEIGSSYTLKMQVLNNQIMAWVNSQLLFDFVDEQPYLTSGGVGYVVDQGSITSEAMTIKPVVE